MYLDNVEETLAYHENINLPNDYIRYTPSLFNKWADWARSYKPKDDGSLRPMGGDKVGPDWARTEFDSLDTFYKFYVEVTEN